MMNIRGTKAMRRIRRALIAEQKPISSEDVNAVRDKFPGVGLTEALIVATEESGRVCDGSRDDLIRALMQQVWHLTEEVNKLKDRKQTW